MAVEDTTGAAPVNGAAVSSTAEQVINKVSDLLVTNGFEILAAILILVIGLWLAKVVSNILRGQLEKTKIDKTLASFLFHICHSALIIFVVIAALTKVGIPTASFIAVLGAAGLAVGFALQGSLSNFAAGILIIIYRPFKVGDVVELGGKLGTIADIHIFTTTMNSPDNLKILIPNAQATSGSITNYTANGTRRVDMVFRVSYSNDIKKVQQIMRNVLAADSRVLADPSPVVAIKELGESSINFFVMPWVKTKDYGDVLFETTEKIKLAFDANDIKIPFPQRDVHLIKD
jgi:small conductance mechanosensitive channel